MNVTYIIHIVNKCKNHIYISCIKAMSKYVMYIIYRLTDYMYIIYIICTDKDNVFIFSTLLKETETNQREIKVAVTSQVLFLSLFLTSVIHFTGRDTK